MVRASAYPTVEWLLRSGRNPIPPSSSFTSDRADVHISTKVAKLLTAWKAGNTVVAQNIWIRTPNGEDPVDVVVERRSRRIGIRFSNRYERDYDRNDALVLVYGRFDTLYRISPGTGGTSAHDLAYAILSMVPSWFTAEGRVSAGRNASAEVLVSSDRLAWMGILRLPSGTITRIRLSRASDWVNAFERALSPPKLTTDADARMARPHP